MKELIKNEVFEKSMTAGLERTRLLAQKAVSAWNALGLTACQSSSDLYDMLQSPQIVFQEGVNKALQPPIGLTEDQQTAHVKKIEANLPDPRIFYETCKQVEMDPYSGRSLMLLEVNKGKVVLSSAAQDLIKQRSLFVQPGRQEKFVVELLAAVEKLSELNQVAGGILDTFGPSSMAADRNLYPDVDAIKKIIEYVK